MWERRTNPHFKHRFYDDLSRLIEADYNNGATVYNYGYDVAGNMVDYDGVTRTYNAANQMTNDGTNNLTYDNNGNLKNDGTNSYTWDRANRLSSVGNHEYVYDGLGARIQQTVSSVVTDYLNDLQPGLTKLLKQTTGASVDRFVHGVRGIHAVDDGTDWNYYAQDGLGSVRAMIDDAAVVQSSMSFDPYGNILGGSSPTDFGFTGEQTDENGSVFLRARYYDPTMGVFSALDPFEGIQNRPMSLNGYSWVEGNPVMYTDPSGMQSCPDYCTPNNYVITNEDSYWTRVNKRRVRLQCEALGCNNLFSDGGRVVTPTPDPFSVPMSTFTPDIIICPTPSPTVASTPSATATAVPNTPTSTATQGVCPTNSLLGCYPGTTNPIIVALVGGGHSDGLAIDFAPIDVVNLTNLGVNPNWDDPTEVSGDEYPIGERTVHAVIDGTIVLLADLPSRVKIRTNDGVCYEFLHLSKNPLLTPNTPIMAGSPLGYIQNWEIDFGVQDGSFSPSHAHLAIYPCAADGSLSGRAIAPLSVLNTQYIETFSN
ncbi:MAG: hypothetical protein Crog4KO_34990 [Crocinitomicaceae bacterium]